MLRPKRLVAWYHRYERPISSASLVAGFVFDALTLRRIDALWDNLWTLGHLLIVALCIVLLNLDGRKFGGASKKEGIRFWARTVQQFFFGGLLSTFLVFYFRSADLSVSWPFLALLAAAFLANERLREASERLIFQVSLFFLCLFSFSIFIIPVLVHHLGALVFVISGAVALFVMWGFVLLLGRYAGASFRSSRRQAWLSIAGIFVILNILYFANLIPPIPLSLKDAGAYRSLVHEPNGDYVATAEAYDWAHFFELYPVIHLVAGDPVFAYSAVFSPASLDTEIVHLWQYDDPATGKWTDEGRVTLLLLGGRPGGYRTYSDRVGLDAGKWRVMVETPSGQVLGVIRFTVVPVSTEPSLVDEVKG